MNEYPVLAGSSTLAIAAPIDLFAGELKVTSNRAKAGASAIQQYQIISLAEDNTVVPFDPTDADMTADGIAAVAVAAGQDCPYFTGGDFNHEALVWPAGVTTLAQRKQIFKGLKTINVSTILK